MTMACLMASKLRLNIGFLLEVLLTWIWIVHGSIPDDVWSDPYNMTCYKGCTCGDMHSNHLHQTLRSVNCSFNNLKALPEELPVDLQILDFKGNNLSEVSENIENLEDLRELDLSGNRIEDIGRGGLFHNISKLQYLDISKNEISTILRDHFSGLKSLRNLILSDNKISYIEEDALKDLGNLRVLDLRHNQFGYLYKELFHSLKKLVILNFSYNKIHSIPASVFRQLKSLEQLRLTGNRISAIDPRAYSGLLNLKILDMNDNLLTRIPTAAFQSLPTLESLTVDQNPISKVKPLDFSHLSVTNISLSQMPELAIIDAKAFYNLINISLIQITNNRKLSYIDPLAFMNVGTLRRLQLSDNNLQGLQKEMQQYLPKSLNLSIYGNPLRCDCNARWLRKMVNGEEGSTIRLIQPGHLVCQTPDALKHKLLKYLDVSKLPKLCSPVVLNLTQSQYLTGTIGERQVVECRALGSPIPQLHWILPDGSLVNSTLNDISRRFFPPGTLVYYHLEPADSGTYTCIAQNTVGSSSSSVVLSAKGIDIFMFPIHVSSTFATLVWNGTEKHAFPSYKVIYSKTDVNGTELSKKSIRIASPSPRKITVRNLDPSTDYHICLGYEDDVGYWLEISCCYVSTPRKEAGQKFYRRISALTIVVTLGITITAAFLFVYLIYSIVRKQRQRFYETPDKSTDSFGIPLVGLYRPLLFGS